MIGNGLQVAGINSVSREANKYGNNFASDSNPEKLWGYVWKETMNQFGVFSTSIICLVLVVLYEFDNKLFPPHIGSLWWGGFN
jgi:hypothetical protein